MRNENVVALCDINDRHPRSGAKELIQYLHQAARAFAGGQDLGDDASLIVARVGPETTAR